MELWNRSTKTWRWPFFLFAYLTVFASALERVLGGSWSLATALSLMMWYVIAPQCISTLAVVRRETNSWRYPLAMTVYLFVLAYAAAFVTFQVARALGADRAHMRERLALCFFRVVEQGAAGADRGPHGDCHRRRDGRSPRGEPESDASSR